MSCQLGRPEPESLKPFSHESRPVPLRNAARKARTMLEEITAELRFPHMPALLEHGDNLGRITSQLERGVDAATGLLLQLREV